MEKSASAATYAASVSAVLFGLTANEIGIYGGLAIAALTFLVNVWFRWHTFKLIQKAAKDKALIFQEGG